MGLAEFRELPHPHPASDGEEYLPRQYQCRVQLSVSPKNFRKVEPAAHPCSAAPRRLPESSRCQRPCEPFMKMRFWKAELRDADLFSSTTSASQSRTVHILVELWDNLLSF